MREPSMIILYICEFFTWSTDDRKIERTTVRHIVSYVALLSLSADLSRSLVQSSCELIATATQNNPKTKEAFLPTLPHLLTILNDRGLPSSVGVKALYAVSCKHHSIFLNHLQISGIYIVFVCLSFFVLA